MAQMFYYSQGMRADLRGVTYHTGLESLGGSDVLSNASPGMSARSHLQSLLVDPADTLPAALHSCWR